MAKILALSGSARRGSLNQRLVAAAAEMARELGAEVTLVDLADFPMPLYHGDLEEEQGVPESATRLQRLMIEHQGLLISCPEYNSSITPLLKNTIDWVSRPQDDKPSKVAFDGKVATLLSASPGALGGLRGLVHVRAILGNIGVVVLPSQVAVGNAAQAFDEHGKLKEPGTAEQVEGAVHELIEMTDRLG